MKKHKNLLIFITGTILFLLSLSYDNDMFLFFSNSRVLLFDLLFSVITNFGVVAVTLFLIPLLINHKKDKKFTYLLFAAFIVSFFLSFIMKITISSARPVEIVNPILKGLDYSFPSMHAMIAFSLLPIILSKKSKFNGFFAIFAVLVALSRVYLGYHFLSDIVLGAFAGYFIGDIILNIAKNGKNKLS